MSKHPGYYVVLHLEYDHKILGISTNESLVAHRLSFRCNTGSEKSCSDSLEDIATPLGISSKTVSRAIDNLIERGWFTKERIASNRVKYRPTDKFEIEFELKEFEGNPEYERFRNSIGLMDKMSGTDGQNVHQLMDKMSGTDGQNVHHIYISKDKVKNKSKVVSKGQPLSEDGRQQQHFFGAEKEREDPPARARDKLNSFSDIYKKVGEILRKNLRKGDFLDMVSEIDGGRDEIIDRFAKYFSEKGYEVYDGRRGINAVIKSFKYWCDSEQENEPKVVADTSGIDPVVLYADNAFKTFGGGLRGPLTDKEKSAIAKRVADGLDMDMAIAMVIASISTLSVDKQDFTEIFGRNYDDMLARGRKQYHHANLEGVADQIIEAHK